MPLSIDTFRSRLAKEAIQAGAGLINDISAGDEDPAMFITAALLKVPIILMHKQGKPATMQNNPQYKDVVGEVFDYLTQRLILARQSGVKDVIIDPGFGFGKTSEHNFSLMKNLDVFQHIDAPLMVGVSRKGMIWRTLGISSEEALNGSTVLHTCALMNGAKLLRVHDVQAAVEACRLVAAIREA